MRVEKARHDSPIVCMTSWQSCALVERRLPSWKRVSHRHWLEKECEPSDEAPSMS